MIESYSFGKMILDGKAYTSDLIIFPDRIMSSWWRKSGHSLYIQDIREALDEKPEVLIIGTGFIGLMKVSEEVKKEAKKSQIELVVKKSQEAVKAYNEIFQKKRTIAAFHLTC